MADLTDRLAAARAHVRVDWSPERAVAINRGIARKRRRARVVRGAVAATAAAAAALVLLFGVPSALRERSGRRDVAAVAVTRFGDGSSARALDPATSVRVEEDSPGRVAVALERGGARFEVVRHATPRVFRVRAGDVVVQVLGTVFAVEQLPSAVRVSVESGRVRVFQGAQHSDLGAGAVETFASRSVAAAQPLAPAAAPDVAPTAEEPATEQDPADGGAPTAETHESSHERPSHARGPSWRELARASDFQRGYVALRRDRGGVRNEPAELLLAADVARNSHHPAEAVDYLRAVVDRHAGDARAPLAAFTLGRVLLDDLRRPSDAAAAFARARSLDRRGALAQDALAREVEARAGAGDTARARALAEEYLRRYPRGHRERMVRRLGGLE